MPVDRVTVRESLIAEEIEASCDDRVCLLHKPVQQIWKPLGQQGDRPGIGQSREEPLPDEASESLRPHWLSPTGPARWGATFCDEPVQAPGELAGRHPN